MENSNSKELFLEIYEHMKRGSYNELCSCVETVITVIPAILRGHYVSPLSRRMQPSFLPEQGPKIFFWENCFPSSTWHPSVMGE